MPSVEIHKVLFCSTAHTTPREQNELIPQEALMCGEYGALIRVDRLLKLKSGYRSSAGLRGVRAAAKKAGARYVAFDSDAEPIPGVKVYDW